MAGVVDTEDWYQGHKDQANFLMVYIEEAHPGTTIDGVQVNQTATYAEREEVAELCTTSLDLTLPTVLDELDNAVEIAYAAFPDRIYVLDSKGVVRHKTLPGPSGWDVSGPRATLDRLLGKTDAGVSE